MIHTDRLTRLFLALASIDNPSRQEAAVSTYIKNQLDELGIRWREDGTGELIHGNAGNLYGYLPGALDLPPILLSAHMAPSPPMAPLCGEQMICPAWRPSWRQCGR